MRRLLIGGVVTGLLLTACASTPSVTPRPSFLQNCAPVVPPGSPTLSCEEAVSAALARLSPDHPRITKVEFFYGYPCDPSASCPLGSGDVGYVNVQMAAPNSDQLIGVVRHADGSLTAGPGPAATPLP